MGIMWKVHVLNYTPWCTTMVGEVIIVDTRQLMLPEIWQVCIQVADTRVYTNETCNIIFDVDRGGKEDSIHPMWIEGSKCGTCIHNKQSHLVVEDW